MLALKLMLMVAGALMLLVAAAIPLVGLWRRLQLARNKAAAEGTGEEGEMKPEEIDWRRPVALAAVGCLPLLVAASIVVVPSGMGGVRISQIGGTVAQSPAGLTFRPGPSATASRSSSARTCTSPMCSTAGSS